MWSRIQGHEKYVHGRSSNEVTPLAKLVVQLLWCSCDCNAVLGIWPLWRPRGQVLRSKFLRDAKHNDLTQRNEIFMAFVIKQWTIMYLLRLKDRTFKFTPHYRLQNVFACLKTSCGGCKVNFVRYNFDMAQNTITGITPVLLSKCKLFLLITTVYESCNAFKGLSGCQSSMDICLQKVTQH